jgi:hypothetical protein
MKWIAKLVTAAQAVLLAQVGAARAADAAPSPDFNEADQWQAAVAAGTPEALQQYLSQYPRGERMGEAFELIVLSEIEAANSAPVIAAGDIQLSEARRDEPERLEHDFDVSPTTNTLDQSGDGESLGPY